jgi:hypothetical protein
MTSAINTSNIDETFPVAGRDNNTQGFRDNFSSIKTALTVAKSEITALQSNSATTDDDNDFGGFLLENAEFNKLYGSVRNNGTVNSPTEINIQNGPLQIVTFSGTTTIRFVGWPDSDLYAKVRMHLKSNNTDPRTVTFGTEAGGELKYSGDGAAFPSPLIVTSNTTEKVVEAWTYNGGLTVYIKYLGEF